MSGNPEPSRETSQPIPQSLTITRTHSPLALWHLLSLDAPTVATLWLCFVAHGTRTHLPPLLAPAMFLAVWLIYAADRLLDTTGLEPRHHFHQRHRTAFLAGMVIATAALSLLLARTRLPLAYYPIALTFLAYFAAVHIPQLPAALRLPKELSTGLLFAAAIFAPELPRHLLAALAFALLCTCNCAWITRWEVPQPINPLSGAILRCLPALTAALLFAAFRLEPLSAAIALAAAALLLLNLFRDQLSPTTLRAAADLALLTPAFFLLSR